MRAKTYERDLCILSHFGFSDGAGHFSCLVLTNAYWTEDKEKDESILSGLVGEFGEDVVLGHKLAKLIAACDRNLEPYRVVPAVVFYTHIEGADFVDVQRVLPLGWQDIQRGINAILEER